MTNIKVSQALLAAVALSSMDTIRIELHNLLTEAVLKMTQSGEVNELNAEFTISVNVPMEDMQLHCEVVNEAVEMDLDLGESEDIVDAFKEIAGREI